MPTLKFKIRDVEFEYVGNEDEIVSFVNRFLSVSAMFLGEQKEAPQGAKPLTIIGTESEDLVDLPKPADKEVIAYITSKPDFAHHLFEVQKHFYGRTFKSRGKAQRMYHRTARQLREIRKAIEKKYDGKFSKKLGSGGLKYFAFEKSPKVSWGDLEKTKED
jgi:hypothetical protein